MTNAGKPAAATPVTGDGKAVAPEFGAALLASLTNVAEAVKSVPRRPSLDFPVKGAPVKGVPVKGVPVKEQPRRPQSSTGVADPTVASLTFSSTAVAPTAAASAMVGVEAMTATKVPSDGSSVSPKEWQVASTAIAQPGKAGRWSTPMTAIGGAAINQVVVSDPGIHPADNEPTGSAWSAVDRTLAVASKSASNVPLLAGLRSEAEARPGRSDAVAGAGVAISSGIAKPSSGQRPASASENGNVASSVGLSSAISVAPRNDAAAGLAAGDRVHAESRQADPAAASSGSPVPVATAAKDSAQASGQVSGLPAPGSPASGLPTSGLPVSTSPALSLSGTSPDTSSTQELPVDSGKATATIAGRPAALGATDPGRAGKDLRDKIGRKIDGGSVERSGTASGGSAAGLAHGSAGAGSEITSVAARPTGVPAQGSAAEDLSSPRPATQDVSAQDLFAHMDSAGDVSGSVSGSHPPLHSVNVGIDDPAHGWVEVRAQGSSGQVTASLIASSPAAHAALHAQLPGLADFLIEREVGVRSLTMGGASGGTPTGADTGSFTGHSGGESGHGSGQNSASGAAPVESARANAFAGQSDGAAGPSRVGRDLADAGLARLISVRA